MAPQDKLHKDPDEGLDVEGRLRRRKVRQEDEWSKKTKREDFCEECGELKLCAKTFDGIHYRPFCEAHFKKRVR